MNTIAFFNNKGGVGKTSLVYHLAWMFSELGIKVLAADLDPQSNLTSMFLDDSCLEELWCDTAVNGTIYKALRPMIKGIGDVADPQLRIITEYLSLIPGDLALASFEGILSNAWAGCADKHEKDFRITSSFYRILEQAAQKTQAEIVLVDVGPNLGAINRAAIIASQRIIIPMAADLFSLQGLKNLGPTLQTWQEEWQIRLTNWNSLKDRDTISLPLAEIQSLGYVLMQNPVRRSRPVKAYERWMMKIPYIYNELILKSLQKSELHIEEDPHCLSILKHYYSLMPLAMEARKPMFLLTPADGAIGAHVSAVNHCRQDFKKLAEKLLSITSVLC